MKNLTSKTISFLRFPSIVMILISHAYLSKLKINNTVFIEEGKYKFFEYFSHLLSWNISYTAVPLFFFISGFLFFFNADFSKVKYSPSASFYLNKYKRRFFSLVIPYIFWNIVIFALIVLSQLFISDMMPGDDKLIQNYTFTDWLNIFWNYKNGVPANQPLWFLRDLIVISFFSPLFFFFIKRLKIFFVIILGILWITDFWFSYSIGLKNIGVFFFTFGAFFSINGKNFLKIFMRYKIIFTLIYLILAFYETTTWEIYHYDVYSYNIIFNFDLFFGVLTIFAWAGYGVKNNFLHSNVFLTSVTFFIYAYHGKPIAFLNRFVLIHLNPINNLTLTISYILIPIVITFIGIGLYSILHKLFPKFTKIITGNR